MEYEIDFGPLFRATDRLRESIVERNRHPENDFVRDSVVQRFEFAFELVGPSLKRFLTAYSVKPQEAREATFPTLIRISSEHGLVLHGWDRWHDYRKARNTTSHAYSAELAQMVVDLAPALLEDLEFLCQRIQKGMPR